MKKEQKQLNHKKQIKYMSQKGKLQEIYQKLKAHNETEVNPALDAIVEELRAAIVAMDADEGEGDPGGNNPGYKPKVP
jgi:hypothetical protein